MWLLWCDKKQSCIDHSMFCVLDVGSTIASPTVIESNSGLGRCLACRTRSSVLLLFNQRLFQSVHLFSSGKHTSTPVCADTTSSILVLFMLRYIWNPTPWRCRIAPRGEVWTRYRVGKNMGIWCILVLAVPPCLPLVLPVMPADLMVFQTRTGRGLWMLQHIKKIPFKKSITKTQTKKHSPCKQ